MSAKDVPFVMGQLQSQLSKGLTRIAASNKAVVILINGLFSVYVFVSFSFFFFTLAVICLALGSPPLHPIMRCPQLRQGLFCSQIYTSQQFLTMLSGMKNTLVVV